MEKDILTEMLEKQYRLLDKHSRLLATPILTGTYPVSCQCCTDENGRMAPYKISFECEAGLSHIWTDIQLSKYHNWGLFWVYTGITLDEVFHYRFRLKYYKLTRKWELKILLNSTSKTTYIKE
ncbi:hypothetical protein [Diplocloster agilis]|uniref:hypothetical protein n=1 Tax=Diplocloster agilis TaxID=2850323 RepID=UPI0008220FAE|nr:hypothetical protein [Suonthocola fibrivorans]MCU6733153.1 hypothetical protein [Suonthocola fibrivorans]SCI79309.1 Uncharacterised protein [uncultured Clostridium sp.]